MDIEELKQRAKDYVELEAETEVISVEFISTFSVFDREDVVLSVETTDKKDPEWWVVGGSTPMNLYSKVQVRSADEAFSFHTGLMMRVMERNWEKRQEPPEEVGYDVFICHASEDKDQIVRPLAQELDELGFYVWYDEFTLKVGDSLRQSIDKGLINSRYGIIVLSQAFFAKNWPQYELNGLTAREVEGQKIILPIWHGITKQDLLRYSPSLADKVALNSQKMNIEVLAREVAEVLLER